VTFPAVLMVAPSSIVTSACQAPQPGRSSATRRSSSMQPAAGRASGLRNSSSGAMARAAPAAAPPANPLLSCSTMRARGAAARTISTVESREPLSTTISSSSTPS
jgi:hypothetical protein